MQICWVTQDHFSFIHVFEKKDGKPFYACDCGSRSGKKDSRGGQKDFERENIPRKTQGKASANPFFASETARQ